jgi:two-component system OmpR family sensor kinase
MKLSLRARLTLWYTIPLLAVLFLFGLLVLSQQGRLGLRRVDRELDALTTTLGDVLRDELSEVDDPSLAAKEVLDTVTAPGRALAILNDRGDVLAARLNGLEMADARVLAQHAAGATSLGAWRVRTKWMTSGPTMMLVLVATPLADVRREQNETREGMLVEIPIVLLLAGAGGLWLASVGLRPMTSALEMQRQFMADASHELRTPVSVVRAATDVTLSREHRDEGEYREALTIIGGQARSMSRLVEDMLVLTRAEAGGYPLQPVDLYLDELVAECRRSVDVLATERGVAIRLAPTVEIPFRGDEDLLRRCVMNVLQNAVQHTPSGGGVNIDVRADPGGVTIRVTDQGPGIPLHAQERIFDRFVQLDPARRSEGTGVGLPIARWIAEAHQGTLVLESSGPTGSTFSLWLPRS